MTAIRHCLALDLKEDPGLIEEYKKYHEIIWPEVTKSIKDAGVENLEIFLTGNRLFMILTVNETFNFDKKSTMDEANPKVQEWEDLMWKFQQALPWAKENEKWILMDRIFHLAGQPTF